MGDLRHNDPVMQVTSAPPPSADGLICSAHYSHPAITEPQEGVLVATAFNDWWRRGGGSVFSLYQSEAPHRSGGWPADEITSEERRYGRPNEQRGITQHKVVLLFQSKQKPKQALIGTQTAHYSALIKAPVKSGVHPGRPS